MATPVFTINRVDQKPNCIGFLNSKTRNKHYKAHCEGIPANKVGAGDMKHKGFQSALAYEQGGVTFMNSPVQAHEWQLVDKDLNIARWNSQTNEFAVQSSANKCLLTYHIRSTEQFATAAFARAVQFYPKGSKGAEGIEGQPGMGEPNEWVLDSMQSDMED